MNQDARAPAMNCLLTLALPRALEEELLDLLRENLDLVPGFSVVHGHGIGAGASLTTAMERVQGRSQRVLVYAVMRESDVAQLVARLGTVLKFPGVFYWTVPILASGRLA